MRLSSFFVITATALVAFPAFAQDAAPVTAPTPAPEKKICRSIVPIGSIMGKRTCHTKAEWKQIDNANSDSAQTGLDQRRGGTPKQDQ